MRPGLRGALMVCGTTSDAGKSTIVAGLCRVLARAGVRVAPFKGQNMALNSVVTPSGHEIGRAQGFQAWAAGVPAEAAMNPVLLKPTGDRTCQVVVLGEPWKVLSAREYHGATAELFPVVLDALADLRARHDVVLCEGAGSPAEINLLDHDIVNLRLAHAAGIPAMLVGNIDPGGVFAALYGTVALLPENLRAHVRGLVINKLRGDPALLYDGCSVIAERTGVPVLGVVPWLDATGLDAEDSLALDGPRPSAGEALADEIDVAVVRFPRISNFTDLDPLAVEPGVRVRLVHDGAALGDPDLVILPGTKATVDDLAWLRRSGLVGAIERCAATVLGICGGYQMMGRTIIDGVESADEQIAGLGWLPVDTRFAATKVTRLRTGTAGGHDVHGYQIHHGRVHAAGGEPFVVLDATAVVDPGGDRRVRSQEEGVGDVDAPTRGDGVAVPGAPSPGSGVGAPTRSGRPDGPVRHGGAGSGASADVDGVRVGARCGTTLHGVLEADEHRRAFLAEVAQRRGKRFVSAGLSFDAQRAAALDALADALAEHIDIDAVVDLIGSAA